MERRKTKPEQSLCSGFSCRHSLVDDCKKYVIIHAVDSCYFTAERMNRLSPSMLKMYISFAGILFLLLAIGLIMLSRYKLTGALALLSAILAYVFLFAGGIIIFYIVFSGPTA